MLLHLMAALWESCPMLPALGFSTEARNLNIYMTYPTFKYWQLIQIYNMMAPPLSAKSSTSMDQY